jgi:hypothetical protein
MYDGRFSLSGIFSCQTLQFLIDINSISKSHGASNFSVIYESSASWNLTMEVLCARKLRLYVTNRPLTGSKPHARRPREALGQTWIAAPKLIIQRGAYIYTHIVTGAAQLLDNSRIEWTSNLPPTGNCCCKTCITRTHNQDILSNWIERRHDLGGPP